ncbi:hypothetical protein LEP1GSC169_0150 [Leptospira santarosai str. HAI1349]|nr:hypothetical protein LEP1GSC169_0150 [Leptospira santarosai str. HAI1349]
MAIPLYKKIANTSGENTGGSFERKSLNLPNSKKERFCKLKSASQNV